MHSDLSSVFTIPKDWEEWIIGTFDPTFDQPARFFAGWDDTREEAIMAMLIRQEYGYDKAFRMSKDEADNEMLLIQACVGPNVYVYKIPYVAPRASSLADITSKAARKQPSMVDDFKPLAVKSTVTKYVRFIEDPIMVMLALCFAALIANVVLL